VRVEGPGGASPAAELGQGDALELVHPADLPVARGSPPPLGGRERFTAVIPQDNGCADETEALLDDLTSRAGLTAEKLTGGRWMAVRVRRSRAVDWTWEDEARLAVALHTWTATGGEVTEARVRLHDSSGRCLVLSALIASRKGYEARATPAFAPCELRIAFFSEHWPAFSPVTSCSPCVTEALALHADVDGWSLIADLMILRSRRRPQLEQEAGDLIQRPARAQGRRHVGPGGCGRPGEVPDER
jgi:hypothetical protein